MTNKEKRELKEKLGCDGQVVELFFGENVKTKEKEIYLADDNEYDIEYNSDDRTYFNKVIEMETISDSVCFSVINELFPSVKSIFAYSDNCGSLTRKEAIYSWWKPIAEITDKTIRGVDEFIVSETDDNFLVFDGDLRYLLVVPNDIDISELVGKKIRDFVIR